MLGNYIVRIYRHNDKKPREFVGVVEEVGKDGRIAFTNLDELWEILSKTDRDAHRLSNLEER